MKCVLEHYTQKFSSDDFQMALYLTEGNLKVLLFAFWQVDGMWRCNITQETLEKLSQLRPKELDARNSPHT